MRVVILGCGRVGAQLANSLDLESHEVSIIDQSNESLQRRLSPDFRGLVVLGNGIDEDILRRAGIERADAFAAVTNDDNTNIMASQIAQVMFNVPKVVCRVYDHARSETYRTLGLRTVTPVALAADRIRDLLAHQSTRPADAGSGRPAED
jgi:trk system potassium uptake protein